MIFLSTYTNKIDAKGRVSVPSSFRGVLEESGFKGLICYPSPILNSIEGCGFNRIKKLSDTIDYQDVISLATKEFTEKRFALVEAVADAVCQRLLKAFDIEKVIIRVRKPHAPIKADFKNVEVELSRSK